MNFDNFTDKEKELYIALFRSVITNTDINADNLHAYENMYDTTSSDYRINVFINTEFEPEYGPNVWNKKNGFRLSVTPNCGRYDSQITAWAASVGHDSSGDDWDQRIFWEIDNDCYDHFALDSSLQMSESALSEHLKKRHFGKIKWTGDLSKDFEIWKSAALECIELFKKYHSEQLKIKFGEAS